MLLFLFLLFVNVHLSSCLKRTAESHLTAYSEFDEDAEVSSIRVENPTDRQPLIIYWPKRYQLQNSHPSIGVFLAGFNGFQPISSYTDVLKYISFHSNMLVVGLATSFHVEDLNATTLRVKQVVEGLPKLINSISNKCSFVEHFKDRNLPKPFLLAQSAGSRAIYVASKTLFSDTTNSSVSGLAFIDPVDCGPLNIIHEILPDGVLVDIDIPILQISSGLGPVPGIGTAIACTPKRCSGYDYWYKKFHKSPRWFVNATEYGHADILDPNWAHLAKFSRFCKAVEDETANPLLNFRRLVAGQIAGFVKVVDGMLQLKEIPLDHRTKRASILLQIKLGRFILETGDENTGKVFKLFID